MRVWRHHHRRRHTWSSTSVHTQLERNSGGGNLSRYVSLGRGLVFDYYWDYYYFYLSSTRYNSRRRQSNSLERKHCRDKLAFASMITGLLLDIWTGYFFRVMWWWSVGQCHTWTHKHDQYPDGDFDEIHHISRNALRIPSALGVGILMQLLEVILIVGAITLVFALHLKGYVFFDRK